VAGACARCNAARDNAARGESDDGSDLAAAHAGRGIAAVEPGVSVARPHAASNVDAPTEVAVGVDHASATNADEHRDVVGRSAHLTRSALCANAKDTLDANPQNALRADAQNVLDAGQRNVEPNDRRQVESPDRRSHEQARRVDLAGAVSGGRRQRGGPGAIVRNSHRRRGGRPTARADEGRRVGRYGSGIAPAFR